MQRLFSTFPASWPGVGLLILRLTIAIPSLIRGMSPTQRASQSELIVGVMAAFVEAFVMVGLWTPVAAALGLCIEILPLITQTSNPALHLQFAALAVSLMMLGPGAFSVDARLFGRKRIEFQHP